jgi:hypothetical protein
LTKVQNLEKAKENQLCDRRFGCVVGCVRHQQTHKHVAEEEHSDKEDVALDDERL